MSRTSQTDSTLKAIQQGELDALENARQWANKFYAMEAHAERLAEVLEEALYLVRLHDSSYLQNFQEALTLYRAENPKV